MRTAQRSRASDAMLGATPTAARSSSADPIRIAALTLVACGLALSACAAGGAGASASPAASLTIIEPKNGATVHSASIEVKGTAPAGEEVVQDISLAPDRKATADGSGNWSIFVELDEGVNDLKFRVGSDKSTARTIQVIYEVEAGAASASAKPAIKPTTRPTAAPTPTPADAFDPIDLSGTGASVPRFTIPEDAAAIAVISNVGASNFAVWTVGADGANQALLVNEIGNYSGTVLFDESDHSVAFKVESDGTWTISVRPVTKAFAWDGKAPVVGHGDDVVRLVPASAGFTTVTITHQGASNFVVQGYSPAGTDLLVNEIGNYNGENLVADGTGLIEIKADGDWSISPPK